MYDVLRDVIRCATTTFQLHFIVPCNAIQADGAFFVKEPTRGRMDVIARSATAALFYSNGVRHNTVFTFVCTGQPYNTNSNNSNRSRSNSTCDENNTNTNTTTEAEKRKRHQDNRSRTTKRNRSRSNSLSSQRSVDQQQPMLPTAYTLVGKEVIGLRPNENGILSPLALAGQLYRANPSDYCSYDTKDDDDAECNVAVDEHSIKTEFPTKLNVIRGIYVSSRSFESVCLDACAVPNVIPIYLHANGIPACEFFSAAHAMPVLQQTLLPLHQKRTTHPILLESNDQHDPHSSADKKRGERFQFVIAVGDHCGLQIEQEHILEELAFYRVSMGRVPLLTSACITLAHHYIDALTCALTECAFV